MPYTITINGKDLSSQIKVDDLQISRGLNGQVGTATLALIVDQKLVPRFDYAFFGQAYFADEGVQTLHSVVITDENGAKVFTGIISTIGYEQLSPGLDLWTLSCQDETIKLDTTVVTKTWANVSDATIISDAFSLAGLTQYDVTTYVTATKTIPAYEAKDVSVKQILTDLAELTGALWYLDPEGKLHWNTGSLGNAPFSLSDQPDNSTSFPYRITGLTRDYSGRANRITYLGGNDDSGNEISVTVEDTQHQADYGVWAITLVDREITDLNTLTLKAQNELAKRTRPELSGTLEVDRAGLEIGQLISVLAPTFDLNDSYIIQSLSISLRDGQPVYGITIGDRKLELTDLLDQYVTTTPATTIPPDGSIGDAKLDRVNDPIRIQDADIISVDFSKVNNVVIQNNHIQSVDFSKVNNVWVKDNQIESVDFSKIIGVWVKNNQIESVDFSKVTNVWVTNNQIQSVDFSKVNNVSISGNQIQNLTITGDKIANNAINDNQIGSINFANVSISNLTVDKIGGWSGGSVSVTSSFTFSGSGGVQIVGGGNLLVTPGKVLTPRAEITSAAQGWIIAGGSAPSITDNTGNGYVSAKYFRAAGFNGQSNANVQIVVDIRNNNGTIEKRTRTLRFDGGIITSIGAVSAWTPI